jgi:hypothetical protein
MEPACPGAPFEPAGLETRQSSLTQGGHAMSRFIRAVPGAVRSAPLWGLFALCCTFAVPAAFADPARHAGMPQSFDRLACYELVQHEGRMIAWARWEQGYSLEKTRSGQFPEGTPDWMVTMVETWITDAYSWQVTDEQVRQWAEELGNTEHLPAANRLSRHETIAIWMRRIARQCAGQPV